MGETTSAVIGDIHAERELLDRVLARLVPCKPDVALLVGDIGVDPPWLEPARSCERAQHDESVRTGIAQIRSALDCPVVFVPGNHDLADPIDVLDGLNCDRRVVEVAGLRIGGLGGAGPSRFGFPYEWDEAQAERALESLSGGPGLLDVVVCHTPPSRCRLDRTHHGEHVGSTAVRRWIARVRPALFVCGHVHEAWGVEHVEGVLCLNAGAMGAPHGQEIGWIVRARNGVPTAIRSFRVDPAGTAIADDVPVSR